MEALNIIAAVVSIISSAVSLFVLNKVNIIKKEIQNDSNNRVTQKNNKVKKGDIIAGSKQ